jgi:hypothetical protein
MGWSIQVSKEPAMSTLYGASKMKVQQYLSLRNQFMNHVAACEHLSLDPEVFAPKPGEARKFVKGR